MRLIRLEVEGFRNLARLSLDPGEHATLVVGPNGQGKTNLLEAVWLLATLRPLRASRFAELVRFGEARARVSGRFAIRGAERVIAVEVDEAGRQAFVDGKPARSLEDYFGGVSVVAFTPDDLAVIKGGPDGRRRLLDRATFNRLPGYLAASREYQRALRARNHLLRQGASADLLDAYGEALAASGAGIVRARLALTAELAPRAAEAFEAIAKGDGGLTISYEPKALPADALADETRLKEALLAALRRRTAHDIERGYTSVGPHADDLGLEIAGRPARLFASQGQQRAAVLAIKVAEIENLRQALGRPPLLLLDDVSSELDPARNAFLMDYLRGSGLQLFLTTTDERLVRGGVGADARVFSVAAGVLSPAESAPAPGLPAAPPRFGQ